MKKARNLEAGPPSQEADPFVKTLPGWRFGHILLGNKHPVQAGSKFQRFGLDLRP